MNHGSAFLASLILVAAAPCGAQSPPPTSAAPASSAPSSTAAPVSSAAAPPSSATAPASATAPSTAAAAADSSEPSPAVLKEARREGFRPKKRNGVTQFCYTDATLGTRFETEKCFDQQHMEMMVQQREDQRRQLQQPGACTGAACSGH